MLYGKLKKLNEILSVYRVSGILLNKPKNLHPLFGEQKTEKFVFFGFTTFYNPLLIQVLAKYKFKYKKNVLCIETVYQLLTKLQTANYFVVFCICEF